jgi:hypothetical protein
MADPKQDESRWVGAWYETWERSLAAWWDKVLDTPEVLRSANQTLAAQVEARKAVHQTGQRWMERMNLPTRADLSRLVRIATLLEEKLLGLDDRLLDVHDRVIAAEREAVRARVEAAETRLLLLERIAALEERLREGTASSSASGPAVASASKPASTRRKREGGAP